MRLIPNRESGPWQTRRQADRAVYYSRLIHGTGHALLGFMSALVPTGVGEVAPQFRALLPLEDLGLVSSSHMVAHNDP